MSKHTYTDAPQDIQEAMEAAIVVPDFLPSPEALMAGTAKRKVTINLSERSVDRFKRYAAKHGLRYQVIIQELVDQYSRHLQDA